jgi:hypothetical protein
MQALEADLERIATRTGTKFGDLPGWLR